MCVVKPSFDRTPIAKGVRSSYAAQKPSPKGLAKYRTGHPPAESGFKTLAIDNGTIGTLFPLEFGSDSDADVVLLDRFDRGFFIYIGFFKEKLSNFAKGRPETGRKPLALPESAKVVFPAGRGRPPGTGSRHLPEKETGETEAFRKCRRGSPGGNRPEGVIRITFRPPLAPAAVLRKFPAAPEADREKPLKAAKGSALSGVQFSESFRIFS